MPLLFTVIRINVYIGRNKMRNKSPIFGRFESALNKRQVEKIVGNDSCRFDDLNFTRLKLMSVVCQRLIRRWCKDEKSKRGAYTKRQTPKRPLTVSQHVLAVGTFIDDVLKGTILIESLMN